jgi:hypothetical protein
MTGAMRLLGSGGARFAGSKRRTGGVTAGVGTRPGASGAVCWTAAEHVLQAAAASARQLWGRRLVAVYAIGSLAHGGFCPHVSDVDVALILSDPLEAGDRSKVDIIPDRLRETDTALARRLSVFWGSAATLGGGAAGGRFAAADRADLRQSGRLLWGADIRDQVPAASLGELIAEGTQLALEKLATAQAIALLKDSAALAAGDVRRLTKWILFPVRLLFTARTARIADHGTAVEHFCSVSSGAPVQLARAALDWRCAPPRDRNFVGLIEAGLLPLYRMFLDEYEPRVDSYGRLDLVSALRTWRKELVHAYGHT